MICINRLLPYTFLFLIKASSGCLESGSASSSHQACGGESYKTSMAVLTERAACVSETGLLCTLELHKEKCALTENN